MGMSRNGNQMGPPKRKGHISTATEDQEVFSEVAGIPEDDEDVGEDMIFRPTGVRRSWRSQGLPNVVDYDPADVKQALMINNYWRKRGLSERIITNNELELRWEEYLDWCADCGVRPLVETGALAIGYSRDTLANWKNGIKCDSERQQITKAFYDTLASFDAQMAVNNKMNPVVYFFRAKNFYEMRDQQEVLVAPNNPLGDVRSPETIAEEFSLLDD